MVNVERKDSVFGGERWELRSSGVNSGSASMASKRVLNDCPHCQGAVFPYRAADMDEYLERYIHQCLQCARLYRMGMNGQYVSWLRRSTSLAVVV